MEPKISVVIPAYNAEKYLEETFKSLVTQSIKPFEVVLIDDGSTDRTSQIAEDWRGILPLEIVRFCVNRGIGSARARGVRYSSGDHIAYLSSDDCYHPRFLEFMSSHLKGDNAVFCNFIRCNSKLEPQSIFMAPPYITREHFQFLAVEWALKLNMFVNFSSVIIPRKFFNSTLFDEDLRYGEDLVFLMNSIAHGQKWSREVLPLLYYREHRGSGTSSGWTPKKRALLYDKLRIPMIAGFGVSKEDLWRACYSDYKKKRVLKLLEFLRIKEIVKRILD